MTHYRFTQAVRILKHTFPLGIHPVPDEVVEHEHFLKYAECGWIHEVDPSELVPVKKEAKRTADLAEKLRAKNKPAPAPAPKKAPEPVREPVQEGDVPGGPPETKPAEQVPEGVQELTPQQRAAATRKANAEKKAAEPKEQ